ncbi:MAG: zinc-binding dehydrogenase [Alphaproteobacteria bacterium]
MRAVLVDPNAPGCLALTDTPEPVPLSSQALVQVKAISLNLGEVRRARNSAPGTQLGWDVSGVVMEPARDGSGPVAGERVVGVMNTGSWAEVAAVETDWMSVLPDSVSCATAATLPVAGLTALYALENAGQLLGQSVMVTGASGGVGLFGIQLAKLSGATVTALIRRNALSELVRMCGADHVVIGDSAAGAAEYGPFYCILDSVGGQVLADSLKLIGRGGVLVNYGVSAGEESVIRAGDFFRAGRARYYGLYLFTEFGRRPAKYGLRVLVDLVSREKLKIHVDAEGNLAELGVLAEQLYNREISGKAVIHVD